jgi:hypothetical protein
MDLGEYLDSLNLKGYQIAIGVLSICALVVVLFFIVMNYSINQTKIELKKPIYTQHEDEFVSVVFDKRSEGDRDDYVKMKLKNGFIKQIWAGRNYYYNELRDFNDFVLIGDTIIKYANNDTIIVKRDSMSHFFVLHEQINKKPIFSSSSLEY